eukprot:CAMPEP_0197048638 /NCGR_PEP_ID=MMETSP1384-20130603/23947_1 /TAXON_ID=29189 /ORGANISM="Ammonia sp." /LENGTH=334 /DNA_ID=CAMNT_0042480797 /DNA_START=82 /DNA_END=1086 /DNA_ORIENTATION=+
MERMHSPHRKRPRYSAPAAASSFSSMHLNHHKIPKKKPPQILNSARHGSSSTKQGQPHSNKLKKVSNSSNQHTTPISISNYRPNAIYSSMIPIQSEAEIIKAHKDQLSNVINFSCINYASLMEYCKYFKLHDFQLNYHYDLASRSSASYQFASNAPPQATQSCSMLIAHRLNEKTAEKTPEIDDQHNHNDSVSNNNDKKHVQNVGARISSKREMDDDDMNDAEQHQDDDLMPGNGKNSKPNKKKRGKAKANEIEHLYFNADVLDRHYCKKKRERIPTTLDPASRLTKSELVDIVREHFLTQPLLKDLSEYDVVKQFLFYIQDRRSELKKDLGFE